MLNPASTDDLADRWHPNPLTDNDARNVAQTRLDMAWRALLLEVPRLEQRITSGEVSTDIVVDVVCEAALRVLRNPEGYVKGSLSIDDYKEAWEKDGSTDLYFTSAELRRVTPTMSGAFTIRPGR